MTSRSSISRESALAVHEDVNHGEHNNDLTMFIPVEHECAYCGKSSFNMKSCAQCWWAKYCHRACQEKHWAEHKFECREDTSRSLYYKGGRVVEFNMAWKSEVPEVGSNEDALFLDLDKCVKNGYNDHAHFISVRDFSIDKLPPQIRRENVLKYIIAESKTAVRLLVKWTSKDRPETDACAKFRGTRYARTASGTCLLDNVKDFHSIDCPVQNCHRIKDLGINHQVLSGDIKIFTNKHVLYDEEERVKTTVDFFYDSADKAGLVREYATQLFYTKPSSDKTFLKVTIHDKELLHRIQRDAIAKTVTFNGLSVKDLQDLSSFAIVISHPHGLPKKISIGRVLRITEENVSDETMANARLAGDLERKWFQSGNKEDYGKYMKCLGEKNLPVYKIWYDTATCQGSSGGPVLYGARMCNGTWGPFIGNHTAYDIDTGLNFFKVVRFA